MSGAGGELFVICPDFVEFCLLKIFDIEKSIVRCLVRANPEIFQMAEAKWPVCQEEVAVLRQQAKPWWEERAPPLLGIGLPPLLARVPGRCHHFGNLFWDLL